MRIKDAAVAVIATFLIADAAAAATSSPKNRSARAHGSAEAVFQEARNYTVRVRTRIETPFIEDDQGSFEGAGFLVDAERRWIVTNAHVVGSSPSNVEVAFADEPFQPAHKVYVDSFADVAVLSVEELPSGRRAAVLDDSEEVQIGEPIGVFGHPLGMYFTGTRGIISNKTDQEGPDLLQMDATVDHGNSGGPVIALEDGRIVGIATAMAEGEKTDRLNFATPIKDVSRIIALLRSGVSPSPPRMEFALLKNDEGRHTMVVARSLSPERWPLQPRDRIVSIAGTQGEPKTLTDFVSALRGRTSPVQLMVERNGHTERVNVMPIARPSIVERRGLVVDGALIAPVVLDDEGSLREPWHLVVHSVEPGSEAEMLGLDEWDIVHTVDGRRFTSVDSLAVYLRDRPGEAPMRLVFMRSSDLEARAYDYYVRELSLSDVRWVGPTTPALAADKK